ncbi:MAG: FAD-dependent oxidoreductase [Chitinophagales bacterium]|nr:FAD-dependent oxidoreductase [Chitinophagales bacterium]
MKLDYLIVGQGIAGSALALALIKRGKRIKIIDAYTPHIPSLAAGAVVNPVTGKKLSFTWRIDELLPYSTQYYTALENELGDQCISLRPIHRYFINPEDRRFFDERANDLKNHVRLLDKDKLVLDAPYGAIEIKHTCQLHPRAIHNTCRNYFKQMGYLIENQFDYQQVEIQQNWVAYQNWQATHIVFCEGGQIKNNPWFNYLPLKQAKGEAIIIEMDGLPEDRILLKGLFIIPEGNNRYYVGSTNEWQAGEPYPSAHQLEELTTKVAAITQKPFKVLQHLSAFRPNVIDRRPILGKHPSHPSLAIFNGLGTKGFSLAPYFAEHLTNHLEEGKQLLAEVDIRRFNHYLK